MHLRKEYHQLKRKIKEIINMIKTNRIHKCEIKRMPSDIVVLWGIPLHGNLGDQAITYAEIEFISKQLPNREIMTIPEEKCAEYLYPIKKYAREKRILFISHGGGNMGVMYKYQEERRQMLIKHIKDCPIIMFPQSVDYQQGTRAHAKAKRLYQAHPDLHLYARDKINYEKMMRLFPKCHVALAPDIVTSLDKSSRNDVKKRIDAIFCVRSDKEAHSASAEAITYIKEYLEAKKIEVMDTYGVQFATSYENQAIQLEDFWNKMKSAKLIVTDRLHGMIFSMITNTPCIALDNSTGKVSAFYNTWMKDIPGILMFSGSIPQTEDFIKKVYESTNKKIYAYKDLSAEFRTLREDLKRYM